MELSTTHKHLVKLMAGGQFFSGQQLAKVLGVSRASVWNYLKVLETAGFEFHAVKGKGTRLKSAIELLDKKKIMSYMSAKRQKISAQMDVLDVCASTNQYLMQQNSVQRLSNGSVCLCEMQTAGRGRLGKSWVSPYGQNVYASFIWNFKSDISALSGLSLACGVAVCEVLKTLGLEQHGLKWPNDILWQGKKLGGILVEIQGESQGGYTAIVGIGVNYKMSQASSADIDQPWVDIHHAHTGSMGRNKLAASLIDGVVAVLEEYESSGLTPYVDRWNALDCYKGKTVRIITGDNYQEGVANGISKTGELQLKKPGGVTQSITSGEVSLRLSNN